MTEVRTVPVRSPSMLAETGAVVRAVLHIVFWSVALMIASLHASRSGDAAKQSLAIDEVAFRTLDTSDQRVFRNILDGVGEAEDARGKAGKWPTVEELAARKLPPFVADPIDHAGYRWRLLQSGTLINYIGTPDPGSKRPTFVIVITEPDPGVAVDPGAPSDETHHRLKDGTMLHVLIWMGTRAIDAPLAAPMFEDGWRRITMVAP
jgi:hypothetical protein